VLACGDAFAKALATPAVARAQGETRRTSREGPMAESVYKVIELVGTSTESWEKAAEESA
jgi:Dodecin